MRFLRLLTECAIVTVATLCLAVSATCKATASNAGRSYVGAAPPWPGVGIPQIVRSHSEGDYQPLPVGKGPTTLVTGATAQAKSGPLLGDAHWLALMVDFSDRPGIAGAASFTQLVQGSGASSLRGYYAEVSYDQLNLLGHLNTTAGWSWSQSSCCGAGQLVGPIAGPPGGGSLPNLTCYQPTGWSGAIVVCNQTGTYVDDSPLLSSQVLYVDWAVINDGAANASTFSVVLEIDGVQARSWSISGLAAGSHIYVRDYQFCALGPGAHTLSVCADVGHSVTEGDEDDNCCDKSITVDAVAASPEWYRVPETHAYYTNHNYGLGDWPQNHQKLIADAVVVADPYVDYSQFDNDGDGEVDYLAVIHAGTGAEVTGSPNDLWSWQGELTHNGGEPVVLDGVTIDRYLLIPERQWYPCDTPRLLGVLAHEFGHLLGLPDLYDTDDTSTGIGAWCLMGYGCQANWGATPVHLCAWAKAQLGWLTPIDVTTSILGASIPACASSPTAYRLRNHTLADGEHFLVENRQRIAFDFHLPAAGLLIYHIDGNQTDNDNEWYCPDHITSGNLLVAVEQADGLWNLEKNNNQGDSGDPWPGASNHRNFSGTSVPNSQSYFVPDPCDSSSNSISVTSISNSAMTMIADLMTNNGPVCLMTAPSVACPLTPITFTSTSWDPDGVIVDWAWDFGDGEAGSGEVVSHVYLLPNSYLVTLAVTDNDGATSTCARTIVVADGIPPVLTCPDDIAVGTDTGSCEAILDPGQATCEDNCGDCTASGERSDTQPLNDPYPVGTTTITWTATDAIGNIATCAQTITVADDEAPVISECPADRTVPAGANCQATIPMLSDELVATDNCDPALSITQSPSGGTQAGPGAHTITITVTDDADNTATCTVTITVTDQSSPTLTVPADVVVNTDPGSCEATEVDLGSASCLDNCGECTISNDAPASFPLGTTVVTWTATDSVGNATNQQQTVTVLDAEDPVISQCPVDRTVPANASCQAGIPSLAGEVIATDNCDDTLSITQSPTAGVTVDLGAHPVTITVVDDSGNSDTCIVTVTVADSTPPTVVPPALVVVETDPEGCQASGVEVGTATCADNCGACTVVGERSDSLPLADPYPLDVTIITWTATDDAGNQASATQFVIVEDVTPPVISQCASDKDLEANGSCQAATPSLAGEVVASDNCDSSLVIVQSPVAGTILGAGAHTVMLTVIDDSGNSTMCAATITVVDLTSPTITQCADNRTLPADSSCQAVVPDLTGEVEATDNCDLAPVVTQSPAAGTVLALGPRLVTLTVTDAAGNSTACMALVTVVDTMGPVITCPVDVTVATDPAACEAANVEIGSATCEDNCSTCTVTATRGDGLAMSAPYPPGETIVTWTATDSASNQSLCTQKITVYDGEAPSISQCAGDKTLPANAGCQAAIPDLTTEVVANDNCDTSLTIAQSPEAGTLVGLGSHAVTLTASDDSGNSAACVALVTVVDSTAPGISQCATDKTLSADASCQAAIPDLTSEVTASDNCSTSLTITQSPEAGTVVSSGDHTVTLTVADDAGNETTCTATVTVLDHSAPTITQCATDKTLSADASCQAAIPDLTSEVAASDNCDPAPTITQSPTAGAIVGTGDHTVTITVTDASGNSATCTATVTVVDDAAPIITQCATDKTLSADASCQAAIPDLTVEVVASDNCDSLLTVTQSPEAGTLVDLADHAVTLTVADDAGNETTCSATVTVIDDTAPTIVQCASDRFIVANDPCAVPMPDLTAGVVASDECDSSLTVSQSPLAGTVVGLGPHTVVLTVTDDAGNSATCNAVVTVIDTLAPTITECASDRTLSADASCETTMPDLRPEVVASDNCDSELIIIQMPGPGSIVSLGDHLVTLTVVDDSGNDASCTAMVTVADETPPEITQCATDKTLSADASCEAVIPDLTAEVTASDNCDPAPTITQSPTTILSPSPSPMPPATPLPVPPQSQ